MTTSADSRFRQKLPFALLPISPSLAAIHAGRARRLNPEDATLILSFCRGCGAYLLNGSATIRSKRVRTGRSKRARRTLEARCGACGEMNQADLPPAAVDPAVSPRPPTRTPALPILAPTPTPTVSLAPTPIPQLGRSSTAAHQAGDTGSGHSPAPIDVKSKKSRPKNKGLQELLARKKQAEAAAATASARSGGLSSFLSEL